MLRAVNLYKPVGMTPLQLIEKWRHLNPEYASQTLSYAGRLDPMAEGVLLVLIGDENKRRKEYEDLPKSYEFMMLLGISTDTYDLLGKISEFIPLKKYPPVTQKTVGDFTGDHEQTLPPYSSFPIRGKPLYYWARRGKLDEMYLPKKTVRIDSLQLKSKDEVSAPALLEEVTKQIPRVVGDFRQAEILSIWQKMLSENRSAVFPLYTFTVECSSGTYVRSLIHAIGEKIKTPSLTYRIRRTRVGEYSLSDSITLD